MLVLTFRQLLEQVNLMLLCELPAGTTPTDLILEINSVNATRGHRHGGRRC